MKSGNSMNNRQSIINLLKAIYHVSQQKKANKYLVAILCFCIGCYALFALMVLFTALDIFAWLMYGAMTIGIIVGIITFIDHIHDAIKQIKKTEM
jgi:MFS-type transporter involved in bile tolerance (Atg22 family)